jgi:hypothetical protein
MIPSTQPNLEQTLLRALAKEPHLSAATLRLLASTERRFSQAAVYKVLHKLQHEGVVVRAGAHYSLSLGWVFELLTFADTTAKRYFSESYVRTLIPAAGKRLSWRFSDLIRCNEFWNQLLLALLKQSDTPEVFSWVPYPWFAILDDQRESRLHQAFRMSGRRFYTNFGHAGSLEPIVKKLYNHKNQVISFAKGPLSDSSHTYVDVVGDYLLSVNLASDVSRRIQVAFAGNGGREKVHPARHLAALTARCKVSVTLEHSPRKASRLRGDLRDFFGC